MARRRKGKSERRARQGLLGLTKTTINKKSNKFKNRDEKRMQKKEQKPLIEKLKETAVHSKDIFVGDGTIKEPHSFVIHTGRIGRQLRKLECDIRQIFSPNTSKELRVTKRNNFKDFLVNGQFLGVSHLVVLTRSSESSNMRIVCCPQGPTFSFRINNFTHCRDILSSQKRSFSSDDLFHSAPLAILSGFDHDKSKSGRHIRLVQSTFQHMFPTINVDTVKVSSIKRALLIYYDPVEDLVDIRHYRIKLAPTGLGKSTKKLMQSKIPDLSRYQDISDFMLNPGIESESEFENEGDIVLPQETGKRGEFKGEPTKTRLYEIGPRLTLKLVKIEEGVDSGQVLYHSYIKKTNQEMQKLQLDAPKIRKKKITNEKKIQHSVVRKLKNAQEKEKWRNSRVEEMNDNLIRKQQEVIGDELGDDSSDNEYEDVD